MYIKRKTLSIQKIGYMILLFPMIEPGSFEQIRIIDLTFNLLKLISYVSIFLLYIGKRRKIDIFSLTVLSCYFTGIISTILHRGWLYGAAVQMTIVVSMILFVKILLEEDPMLCFDVFLPLLKVLIYANLISIILFPNGMYTDMVGVNYYRSTNWILGTDNGHVPYLIAGMTIAIVRDYYQYGKAKISFRSWCLIVACYMTVFIRWPATAVVGMIIIFPVIFMPKLFAKRKWLNIVTYMIVAEVFFFAVVIFRTQNYLGFLIQGFLHKDLTFSGRTPIWNQAMSAISAKPLLGWGVYDSKTAWGYLGHVHAHNIILQMLFSGGILQLVFFLYFHILTMKKLMKNKHNVITCFFSVMIFSMLIMNQMEIYQSGIWFLIYALAYNSDKIIMHQRECQLVRNRS